MPCSGGAAYGGWRREGAAGAQEGQHARIPSTSPAYTSRLPADRAASAHWGHHGDPLIRPDRYPCLGPLPWPALPQTHSAVLEPACPSLPSRGRTQGRESPDGALVCFNCCWVCAGTEKGMAETFGSTCHGAGRASSRNSARRNLDYQTVRPLEQLLLCNLPCIPH